METVFHLSVIILILTFVTDGLVSSDSSPTSCEFNLFIKDNEQFTFTTRNFTNADGKAEKYCTMLVTTDTDRKIVMDLTYKPRTRQKIPDSSCHSDYVHIGNDVTRLDVDVMTSYKFCGVKEVRHELVSRGNKMWLVFKAERTRPKELQLDVSAKEPVSCSPEEFTCSPVQCVSRSEVCNGVKDCDNGHDEYCSKKDTDRDMTNPVPLSHTLLSCFRCGDGTCITPRLPRYDLKWGHSLWYLCDGYPHCPDQWDERPDICLTLQRGRVGAVMQCVPADLQFGLNRSVIMWNEHRCDGVADCHHGEDEIRCQRKGDDSSLRADPITLGFVIGFFIVICCVSAVVIHRLRTRTVSPAVEPPSDDMLLQTRPSSTYYAHDHGNCQSCLESRNRQTRRKERRINHTTSQGKSRFAESASDDVFTPAATDDVHYGNKKKAGCDDEHKDDDDDDDDNGNDTEIAENNNKNVVLTTNGKMTTVT